MPLPRATFPAIYGFGLFPLPAYRSAQRGPWCIRTHLPSLGDGYLRTTAIEARAVLSRGREVWMSTGLLEQESHAWHVHCAQGVVVAAGIGLGMYVYAAAMKPTVELVIAADISPDILALMQAASGFERWPCRHKVKLVEADALDGDFADRIARCADGRPIDYLYADIWPQLPAAEAPAQTSVMARAVAARAAGWWGQELSFAAHCRRAGCRVDVESLHAYFASVGVPPPVITPGYAAFCRDVMAAYARRDAKPLWQRLKALLRGK